MTKVGLIGCGNISGIYFENAKILTNIEIAACADLNREAAEKKADEFDVKPMSVDELLADKSIGIVLNLTVPKAHFSVAKAALEAGKHVYNEKPLCLTFAQAKELLALAEAKKLKVGCAPDTFLGAGIQTCRQIIDQGLIGKPVAATAFMTCHGHESWHPAPEFYYEVGGGPMLDMGPYYVTALVNLLGPVKRVAGSAQAGEPERLITSAPKKGKRVKVETPTHIAGTLDFHSGAVATVVTSFDIWHAQLPRLEIYGTEGSLSVPDPNTFGGPVFLRLAEDETWKEIPLMRPYAENSRGLGLADLASAVEKGRSPRAGAELALHVLEVMEGFTTSSNESRYLLTQTKCERPAAMPAKLGPGEID